MLDKRLNATLIVLLVGFVVTLGTTVFGAANLAPKDLVVTVTGIAAAALGASAFGVLAAKSAISKGERPRE